MVTLRTKMKKWYCKGGLLLKNIEPPVSFKYKCSNYKEIRTFLSVIA